MQYKYLILPQNYLAEEILLGTIFIYPDICHNFISLVKPEYFFLEHNKIICTCLQIVHKKKKVNFYEILNILEEIKILQIIGGTQTINNLMKQSQVFISSFHYMNFYLQEMTGLIKENYIKRLMIQYGYNVVKLGHMPKISHDKIYNKALYYLNANNNTNAGAINSLGHLIAEFILIKKIEEKKYQDNHKNIEKDFITSGFKEFDKIIRGLSKGDLIIIAGRPSTGKTSFSINIVHKIMWNIKNIGLYFFSLEMSSKQILHKLISINLHIPLEKIAQYRLCASEWMKIIKLCYQLIDINLKIDDNSSISIDYIEHITRLLKKDSINLNLIIVDYLQLIQSNIGDKLNRSQELSYITRKLKILAQNLNLPIIVLSQLNRNIENRADKTPILSDLRESGCVDIFFRIHLKNKYEYKANCISIVDQVLKFNKLQAKYKTMRYLVPRLNISTHHKFCHRLNILNKIHITYNHKFIFYKYWLKQYFVLENSLLVKCIRPMNINYYFSKTVESSVYSKSYDFYIPKYFHFLCENILLHNSIEQDADIITMIYSKENYSNSNKLNKVLDFIICKNRNGPTGSFKLLFRPEINLFESYFDNK
uniref:DNA 5'-3' helicase n=1 Tax=Caloglossa intermedia TaxID=100879 RepID=A0A1Z1M6A3_9FLOR|nr:Replication helicase subunit [Caloglossa intermedia]ARW61536.1 Replication helicase subunit [Caloglossa intermedia]